MSRVAQFGSRLPKSATLTWICRVLAACIGLLGLAAALGFHAREHGPIRVPKDCSSARTTRFVLIVLDGVRYQDVFLGADADMLEERGEPREGALAADVLVPNLQALAARGVALGAPGRGVVLATGPNFVSLPGYAEILTGRPSRCSDNDCVESPSFTILDGFARRHGAGTAMGFSSWPEIERVAAPADVGAVISTGRWGGATRPMIEERPLLKPLLDRGTQGSTRFESEYREDEHTIGLAREAMRSEEPMFLFVALGDTDEHAHQNDYAAYLAALRRADAFVGDVVQIADGWRDRGIETVILVTADHGRSNDFAHHGRDYPESARSWIIAAGGPIPARGAVASPDRRYLSDIAPTIAALANIPIEVTRKTGAILDELAPDCAAKEASGGK